MKLNTPKLKAFNYCHWILEEYCRQNTSSAQEAAQLYADIIHEPDTIFEIIYQNTNCRRLAAKFAYDYQYFVRCCF